MEAIGKIANKLRRPRTCRINLDHEKYRDRQKYLYQDRNRKNITGSQNNIDIDIIYLERDIRSRYMKHIWIAIEKTCNAHLDHDRIKLSGKIARDVQGDQKDPNRQNR